jgi:hypothetical protein
MDCGQYRRDVTEGDKIGKLGIVQRVAHDQQICRQQSSYFSCQNRVAVSKC